MIIKIDCREHSLIKLCKHYIDIVPTYKGVQIVTENLPIGDIILNHNGEDLVIIERKTLADLGSSLKDGRYEEQSYRLTASPVHNHNIFYLIEGGLIDHNVFRKSLDKTTLYSCLFSLSYYKGFSVIKSDNIEESARIICNMGYKLNKNLQANKKCYYNNLLEKEDNENNVTMTGGEKDYCDVVKKVKKDNITPNNIGEIMLSQLPGISSVSAKALIQHFDNINNLIIKINENEDCLSEVTYITAKGVTKRINKTVINNIKTYLKPSICNEKVTSDTLDNNIINS